MSEKCFCHFGGYQVKDAVARKQLAESEIYVTPQMFGAKGDGVADDADAVQAMFNYVAEKTLTFQPNGSIYTGQSPIIVFPTGVYVLGKQINVAGTYIDIRGDRSVIRPTHNDHTFYFGQGGTGWMCNIDGLTFDKGFNSLYFDCSNLEMGNTNISNCWFYDQTGHAIYIKKQSQIANIHDCKFNLCEYVLECESVDRIIFENNWIGEKPRSKPNDASIINRSMRMILRNNLFVPRPATAAQSAYINAYTTTRCIDNHFGGEAGSKTVINVMGGTTWNPDYDAGLFHAFEMEVSGSENLWCSDGPVVRLFTLPSTIRITNNHGLYQTSNVIGWADGVDQDALISDEVMPKIDITMNNGGNFRWYNRIPDNLKKYLINYTEATHRGKFCTTEKISETEVRISGNTASPLFVEVGFRPSAGSTEYRSNIVGVINSSVGYSAGALMRKVVFTPIATNAGGADFNNASTVEVVYEDTGTNKTAFDYSQKNLVVKCTGDIVDGYFCNVVGVLEGQQLY